jgi:hypothetical protein
MRRRCFLLLAVTVCLLIPAKAALGQTCMVSGNVAISAETSDEPYADVSIIFLGSGGCGGIAYPNSAGNYSITLAPFCVVTVVPQSPSYAFSPTFVNIFDCTLTPAVVNFVAYPQ